MVREIEIGLLEMDNQSSMLLRPANKHLHDLAAFIDNPFAYVRISSEQSKNSLKMTLLTLSKILERTERKCLPSQSM